MIYRNYTEKEILVMESLLTLYAKGIPFHSIKVADIASEADIGKGTVYEYFHSKEEIIANAVAYRISNEFQQIHRIIASAKTFEDCTYTILEKKAWNCKTQSGSFLLMRPDIVSSEEVRSVLTELQDYCGKKGKEMVRAYLEIGEKEGLFPPIADEIYGFQVVTSVISGFYVMLHKIKDVEKKTVLNNCYQILIKSLNSKECDFRP